MKAARSICIVSCCEEKREAATWAEDLYISESFFLARRYAQAKMDRWLIFSAKHGLVRPGSVIEPYNQTIPDRSSAGRKRLERLLILQKKELGLDKQEQCISLCNGQYNEVLESAGLRLTSKPVEHFSKPQKKEWLRTNTDPHETEADLDTAYKTVFRLVEGKRIRPLKEVISEDLPSSGVYIFFDPMERRLRESRYLRIVRVGTHGVASGSKATLRQRLRTHFGSGSGGGNHRSSIFRLHVGKSFVAKHVAKDVKTWGSPEFPETLRERQLEEALESKVSEYIGNLLVTLLEVPGEASKHNDRAYLEQNLIALLSNSYVPLDPPSHNWLGSCSDKIEIRKSGIWNVNHTAQTYEREFLPILSYYVGLTLGEAALGPKPLTSPHWAANVRRDVRQSSLF